MLSAAALGVTISWGMIASKTLEGIARQPEMKGELMFSTFIFAGLMESFPFIVMAIALWLLTANPLLG
jgi:F-type H+-transporting ATPase subunit c